MTEKLKPIFNSFQEYIESEDMIFDTCIERVTMVLKIKSKGQMSHRNLKYLNNNRIIYRRYSSDIPTSSHRWGWYYANGTMGIMLV